MSEERKIPRHVAFILDGNGRWAKAKGMPRNYGHVQGAKAVEQMLFDAGELGIEYVTVYAFSTENWNRPEAEVSALMALFKKYLKSEIKTCMKNNVRSRVIGEKNRLPKDVLKVVEELEETTKDNTGLTFNIAINYGSRDEITRAVRKIASKVESGEISGGMLPKIRNCIDAVNNGVNRVHILDGRKEHCLLLEFFTQKGIGTAIIDDENKLYEHEVQY